MVSGFNLQLKELKAEMVELNVKMEQNRETMLQHASAACSDSAAAFGDVQHVAPRAVWIWVECQPFMVECGDRGRQR
jgi:hypothetical protein